MKSLRRGSRKTNPLVSFRAFSALQFAGYASWGVAPGYYISRLWRFKPMAQHTEASLDYFLCATFRLSLITTPSRIRSSAFPA